MKHKKNWTIGLVILVIVAVAGTIAFINGNKNQSKEETEIAQDNQENTNDTPDTTEEEIEEEGNTQEGAQEGAQEDAQEDAQEGEEQEEDADSSDEANSNSKDATNPDTNDETSADTDDDSEAIAAMTDEERLEAYLVEETEIMDTMMKGMENIPHTGDTALDFLYGMIPHHEAAIAMAESALKYGATDEEVVKNAEDVIRVQTQENEDMAELIKKLDENPNIDEKQEKKYLKEYNMMFDDSMSHESSSHGFSSDDSIEPGSVDEAFASGMIMHHKMAIDMSESILDYTDNTSIREMADGIIEVQKDEIKQMEDLVERLK